MSPKPRDVLVELVANYGDTLLSTPVRCEGLLKDYCSEHRREVTALMNCLRGGLVQQLQHQNGTPIQTTCSYLAAILENADISSSLARWTIETWAVALGLLNPAEVTEPVPEVATPRSILQAVPETPTPPATPPTTRRHRIEMPPEVHEAPKIEEPVIEAPAKPEFLAQPLVPKWGVPDWSQPARQVVVVHPDGSRQKPTLREAVNQAIENTCLVLRPGVYKEGVVVKRNLQIRGDGDPAAIILEATSSSVILLDGACLFVSGVTLKGVAGKDKKAAVAVGVQSGHLAMEYCNLTSDTATIMEVKGMKSEVTITHCHFHDGKAGGIVFQDSAAGYLEDCHFYQNKLSHVVIGKGCAPTLLSCKISNGLMAGLYVNDGGAGLIENCDIWGNAVAGIQCQRKGNPRVRLCRISLNERYGVLVAERGEGSFDQCQFFDNARTGVTIGQQSRPSFSRCLIFDNHGEGVEIGDQSVGEFLDCEIFNNEGPNVLMKDKSNTLFRRCQVRDGLQEGIRLMAGAEGVFEQCTIAANAKTGLLVNQQSKPILQGCLFSNGKEGGIAVLDGSEAQFVDCTLTGHAGMAVSVGEKAQARFEKCKASDNPGGDWNLARSARVKRTD